MIYGFGGRVDNDSNAITIIDEENRTAETKGYVNGEYVEFSGEGGGGASPLIVHELYSEQEDSTLLDVTFGEIFEAINAGRNIYRDMQESPSFDYTPCRRVYMQRFDDGEGGYTYTAAIEFGYDSVRSYDTPDIMVSEEAVYQSYPIYMN